MWENMKDYTHLRTLGQLLSTRPKNANDAARSDGNTGAMTALAQLLLILTSVAPIGLVYAGVLLDLEQWLGGAILVAVAGALALACRVLLKGAASVVAPTPKEFTDVSPREGDSLAFLVAYALPLLAVRQPIESSMWGLVVFTALVGVLIWQQQIFHINPVLALLGYRFYSARNDASEQVLVLTRRKVLGAGVLQATRLSDYLWLEDE